MSDLNSSPVSLPAGGYDYDDLKKGLDKAAKGADKSYDENVTKAVETAAGERPFEPVDPRLTPGYEYADVKNEALGVTERIQVSKPDTGDDSRADAIPPSHQPAAARAADASKE